eukprot:5021-Heterococcus_DN1.PRE.2
MHGRMLSIGSNIRTAARALVKHVNLARMSCTLPVLAIIRSSDSPSPCSDSTYAPLATASGLEPSSTVKQAASTAITHKTPYRARMLDAQYVYSQRSAQAYA